MLKVKNYLLVIVTIIICLVLVGCTLKTDLPINNEQVTQQPEQAKELTTEEISELENDYIPYFYDQYQVLNIEDSNATDWFIFNTIVFDYENELRKGNGNYEFSNTIEMNKLREILKETIGNDVNDYTKDISGENYTIEGLFNDWSYLIKITDIKIDGEKYNIEFDAWIFSEDGLMNWDEENSNAEVEQVRQVDVDGFFNYLMETETPDHSSITIKKNSDYKYFKYQMVK
jgi:hypothetical protein